MPSGRMLDVGCHVGTFLTIAEQHGFEVAGVEPSHLGVGDRARPHLAARCTAAPSRTRRCPRAATTSITLWDVIEHLPDPGARPALHPRVAAARRHLRRLDHGRRLAVRPRARPALAVVHADAPRLLLAPPRSARCCAARASRSSTSGCTRAASGSRTWPRASTPTPRRSRGLLVAGLKRVGLDERTVGIKLGDIFTVIARKPARVVTSADVDRARASVARPAARWPARPCRRRAAALGPGASACRSSSGRWSRAPDAARGGDGRLGRAAARLGRPGRRADHAAALVGRLLVPVDRAVRLRPHDRPRQLAGVLPALPDDPVGRREGAALLLRGDRRDPLEPAVPAGADGAVPAHPRAVRTGDRQAHHHVPLHLAAVVRVLDGLHREPRAAAHLHHLPAPRAAPHLGREHGRRAGLAGAARRRPAGARDRLAGVPERRPQASRAGSSGSCCPCCCCRWR